MSKLDKPLNLKFATANSQCDSEQPAALSGQASQTLENTVAELKRELQVKQQLIEAKSQEISELKNRNRQLMQENRDTQERQKLLDEELGKAEAHIELIMELIGEENADQKTDNRGSDE